jgi:hypothetical protein
MALTSEHLTRKSRKASNIGAGPTIVADCYHRDEAGGIGSRFGHAWPGAEAIEVVRPLRNGVIAEYELTINFWTSSSIKYRTHHFSDRASSSAYLTASPAWNGGLYRKRPGRGQQGSQLDTADSGCAFGWSFQSSKPTGNMIISLGGGPRRQR